MSLTGKTIANSHIDLLQMNNSNNGVDGTLRNVLDGEGTISAIRLSTDHLHVKPVTNKADSFKVQTGLSENLIVVDALAKNVKLGIGQQYANTGYLEYGCDPAYTSTWAANLHFPIPQNGSHGYAQAMTSPNFGSGANPDLSKTWAAAGGNLPKLWHHLPDAITIDQIYIWVGNDDSASDVIRFRLTSYDIVASSGVTCGDLSGGVVIASGGDITTTDSDRLHYQTISASPVDVDAGKVLLLTCRQDSINSDLGISCKIKYHLQ